MDMQKPGPRGRSSSINPGPGAAVECKTPGVARGGGCWCLELTDALPESKLFSPENANSISLHTEKDVEHFYFAPQDRVWTRNEAKCENNVMHQFCK